MCAAKAQETKPYSSIELAALSAALRTDLGKGPLTKDALHKLLLKVPFGIARSYLKSRGGAQLERGSQAEDRAKAILAAWDLHRTSLA